MIKYITETQLRTLINEELGIALEVVDATNELYLEILKLSQGDLRYNSLYSLPIPEVNQTIQVKYDCLSTTLFGCATEIWVNVYVFSSRIMYDMLLQQYPEFFNVAESSRCETNPLYNRQPSLYMKFFLPKVEGQIITPFLRQSLQHELSHLYEQCCMNHHYQNSPSYYEAMNTIANVNCSELQRAIALILYYAGYGEYVAFENTLYGELQYRFEQHMPTTLETLKTTSIYRRKAEIEHSLKIIQQAGNTHTTLEIMKSLGYKRKFSHLVGLAKYEIAQMERMIKRGWAKFCKDNGIT